MVRANHIPLDGSFSSSSWEIIEYVSSMQLPVILMAWLMKGSSKQLMAGLVLHWRSVSWESLPVHCSRQWGGRRAATVRYWSTIKWFWRSLTAYPSAFECRWLRNSCYEQILPTNGFQSSSLRRDGPLLQVKTCNIFLHLVIWWMEGTWLGSAMPMQNKM